jgi:hypothetical protein
MARRVMRQCTNRQKGIPSRFSRTITGSYSVLAGLRCFALADEGIRTVVDAICSRGFGITQRDCVQNYFRDYPGLSCHKNPNGCAVRRQAC